MDLPVVKASFLRKDGTVVAGEAQLAIAVEKDVEVGQDNTTWFGDRTRVETVKFAITLFATVPGLVRSRASNS